MTDRELMQQALYALEQVAEYFNADSTEAKTITAIREALAEQPSEQQEPFGYFRYDLRLDAWVQNRDGRPGTPFYTSPPASKPWVGLTDEEIDLIGKRMFGAGQAVNTDRDFVRAIEAKLSELNNG